MAIQYFTREYLSECKKFSKEEILKFLNDFSELRVASETDSRSKLISVRIEERLLSQFKMKASSEGIRYQTKLKELMKHYVLEKQFE